MKKSVIAAATAAVLGGCVSAPSKPVESKTAMQGKQVVLAHYAMPDFAAMTPGKAAFGLFGAAAMIHAGNAIVQADHIPDPAIVIGQRLANDLAAKEGASIVSGPTPMAMSDQPATLLKTYAGTDIILDVKTLSWMYSYYPTKWQTYHVFYVARVRLLDGHTGSLIAQQLCKVDPTDPKNPPSLDQLQADDGAMLKAFLGKAADTCVNTVEQQALRV